MMKLLNFELGAPFWAFEAHGKQRINLYSHKTIVIIFYCEILILNQRGISSSNGLKKRTITHDVTLRDMQAGNCKRRLLHTTELPKDLQNLAKARSLTIQRSALFRSLCTRVQPKFQTVSLRKSRGQSMEQWPSSHQPRKGQ